MLKKLLKYEFKATGRVYGGLYLAILAVAVLMGVSFQIPALLVHTAPIAVLMLVYLALGVAIAVMTVLSIIQRFTRNLLGREGYLMHTLPVSNAQLILAKLIPSIVWVLCSIVVVLCPLFCSVCSGPSIPLPCPNFSTHSPATAARSASC